MPAGRPKSEATIIKELEARIKDLEAGYRAAEEVANNARAMPIEMGSLFFDMWCILEDMTKRFDQMDEGLLIANLTALKLMADKGSDYY